MRWSRYPLNFKVIYSQQIKELCHRLNKVGGVNSPFNANIGRDKQMIRRTTFTFATVNTY